MGSYEPGPTLGSSSFVISLLPKVNLMEDWALNIIRFKFLFSLFYDKGGQLITGRTRPSTLLSLPPPPTPPTLPPSSLPTSSFHSSLSYFCFWLCSSPSPSFHSSTSSSPSSFSSFSSYYSFFFSFFPSSSSTSSNPINISLNIFFLLTYEQVSLTEKDVSKVHTSQARAEHHLTGRDSSVPISGLKKHQQKM